MRKKKHSVTERIQITNLDNEIVAWTSGTYKAWLA